MGKLTPMLEQYHKIKEQHKDAILFFRVGDFYETFYDDAKIASRELDIVLTGRDNGNGERYPLAGVPYHSVEPYINRLVEKGYKIAICEQVQDPKEAKGIVEREVVRIVTPGTIVDGNFLAEKKNNYLVGIAEEKGCLGLSYADFSTGEFAAYEFRGKDCWTCLQNELARLQPAEVIYHQKLLDNPNAINILKELNKSRIEETISEAFSYECARKLLCNHFGVHSLESFGFEDQRASVCAAGAVYEYLQKNHKSGLSHIRKFTFLKTSQYVSLDKATRRNLELTSSLRDNSSKGTLLDVLDFTCTAMGGRTLRKWIEQPLLDLEDIKNRLDSVEEFVGNLFLREDLRELLKQVYDLERLMGKIALGSANARDLLALGKSLEVIPFIQALLSSVKVKHLAELGVQLDSLDQLQRTIAQAIVDEPPFSVREGGIIKDGFSSELDHLRTASKDGKTWIAALENKEKLRTGIKSLKVRYNKVFGYYIEITNANLDAVPKEYIRKQTLSNAERYITPELKEYENLILGAEEKAKNLEYELFCEIRNEAFEFIGKIQKNAAILAEIDVLLSFAEAAVRYNYTKPSINNGNKIYIKEGRHPVVEHMLKGELFIPNDTFLDGEKYRMAIITGPNMAGKSTYMRQVALITLMAQIGSFVPAKEAEIGLVDRIFARVGASDDLSAGQSTFMMEMTEVANILNNASSKSLIILDEIGRGTSTYDGLSIAWAVAEYIHDNTKIGAKTLFATHYHELTDLEDKLEGVVNYSTAVKENGEEVVFLRRIIRGKADRSYGIHVARLAGLPQELIDRAYTLLKQFEKGHFHHKTLSRKETVKTEETNRQLSFLSDKDWEFIRELTQLDLMTLTPLEALNKLYYWQQKLKQELTG